VLLAAGKWSITLSSVELLHLHYEALPITAIMQMNAHIVSNTLLQCWLIKLSEWNNCS